MKLNKATGLITDIRHLPIAGDKNNLINGGKPMPVRRCAVIHYTEGGSTHSSVEWWGVPASRRIDLGAHFIIDRDGEIFQCRSINRTISHAGVSRWKDPKTGKLYQNLNSCSIGIELANTGSACDLIKGEEKLPGYAGTLMAKHRNESKIKKWEQFGSAQAESCRVLCKLLVDSYNLDDITGHYCIAPERKIDPGPAFGLQMKNIRDWCGFGFTLPAVHKI